MVRTRDGGARKAVAAKAPRKVLVSSSGGGGGPSGMGSPSGKVGKYTGGNGYCPRPTPDWQKGMEAFVVKKAATDKENCEAMDETVACPASSGGSTTTPSAATAAAQGSSSSSSAAVSSSQDSSSSSSPQPDSPQPEHSSPVKKNGLISDSDED